MSGSADRIALWGRSLFERQRDPVVWAGGVLEAASVTLGKSPEIQAALALAVDSTQWPEGRAVFDRIRQRGLDQDKPLTAAEDLCFRLAELVAKLAHNAAGPPPPFDYHAGWQVGPIAYRVAGELKDPALRRRLAAALGGWPEAE
ncbi:hypothetical protein OG478_01145 [Streptomyces phaeochromogenes]|uniref:hypothetical protein n=1 Tax=Streptomyces phaeochromogenes TaxID=1923 RepID=UPI00386DC94E|nr:hypothetical protein OG478_01145 [Streptomyces phaeochromogenes]